MTDAKCHGHSALRVVFRVYDAAGIHDLSSLHLGFSVLLSFTLEILPVDLGGNFCCIISIEKCPVLSKT